MLRRTQVLIIGGGLQACALAARLAFRSQSDFLIVDPNPLLTTWSQGMEAQGLEVLRTPYSAHIDPRDEPGAMWQATNRGEPTPERLAQPAEVGDFNRFCKSIIDQYQLERQRVSGWVTNIAQGNDEFLTTLVTAQGEEHIVSDAVVVAIGLGRPIMPGGQSDWRVQHSDFVRVRDLNADGQTVCILGGGLTAGTLAVCYADEGARVVMACRSSVTVSQLESDPEWVPGKRLSAQFSEMEDWNEKARQLRAARVGRGVTPEVWSRLTRHIDSGDVVLHENVEVQYWESLRDERLLIPQVNETVDQIVCATGYRLQVQDVPFLASLRDSLEVTSGLPHVDQNFESVNHRGLYFMGKLGELGGGPLSRNVPGARIAAARIVQNLR